MSNRKKILELTSRANQLEMQARAFKSIARELQFKDVLVAWGMEPGDLLMLDGFNAKPIEIYSLIRENPLEQPVVAKKIKKDGTESVNNVYIYRKDVRGIIKSSEEKYK